MQDIEQSIKHIIRRFANNLKINTHIQNIYTASPRINFISVTECLKYGTSKTVTRIIVVYSTNMWKKW